MRRQDDIINESRAVGGTGGVARAMQLKSPLTDVFPECREIPFGAVKIAGDGQTFTTPMCAWFCLRRIAVTGDTGVEVGLHGYRICLGPPDGAGSGYGPLTTNAQAWGYPTATVTHGLGAALVIGVNLPCGAEGSWSGAPSPAAFVDPNPATAATLATVGQMANRMTFPFPPGDPATLTVGELQSTILQNHTPLNWRVPQNSTLDVALVLRGANKPTAGNFLYCFIDGWLHVGAVAGQFGFTP